MKRLYGLLVAALGMGAVACGNNECEDAADKIVDECKISGVDEDEDETAECNSTSECAAKCTNDSSCAEIKAFFEDFTTDNAYTQCLAKCA